jgi:hypothetical protein
MRPFQPGETLPEWLAQLDTERAPFEAGGAKGMGDADR